MGRDQQLFVLILLIYLSDWFVSFEMVKKPRRGGGGGELAS